MKRVEQIYIVFDGPPAHESGRFVEVENENAASVGFIPDLDHGGEEDSSPSWTSDQKGFWRLGPFWVDSEQIARNDPPLVKMGDGVPYGEDGRKEE